MNVWAVVYSCTLAAYELPIRSFGSTLGWREARAQNRVDSFVFTAHLSMGPIVNAMGRLAGWLFPLFAILQEVLLSCIRMPGYSSY